MYEAKTKPTTVSLAAYLKGIADETRRKDCRTLATMMTRVTGCKAVMWGPGIVGFDRYHYKYPSGHEGESCQAGFSSRKGDISVYLSPEFAGTKGKALLAKLGRHKMGKSCLYIRKLEDVDIAVLEQMVAGSVADTRRRYPG